jgi:putative membrane protein
MKEFHMKSIRVRHLALFSAALMLFATSSAAFAQAAASDDDKHFVEEALKGGKSEVELGRLATQKGASDDVKMFGQKMVEDHTKLGEKMKAVAAEIGVKPPDMASAGGIATKAKLEMLSGKSFDDAYISAMVKDHEEDLQAFKNESANGSSPSVKRAAHQGEMVVSEHLEMIRKIAQAHNVSAQNSQPSARPSGL